MGAFSGIRVTRWISSNSTPTILKKDFTIYPNPVVRGNSIQVKLALPQPGDYKLELINTAGQVMLIQPLFIQTKEQQITLYTRPDWSAGIYFVRISAAGSKKIFQQKVLLK
nr:T9SS type A sorting domain-containing protein [Longitalea arenae]